MVQKQQVFENLDGDLKKPFRGDPKILQGLKKKLQGLKNQWANAKSIYEFKLKMSQLDKIISF